MPHIGRRLCLLVCVSSLALSLSLNGLTAKFAFARATSSPLAASLDAGFAVDWMQLIYDRVKAEKVDAPSASRIYAYAGETLYQSVVDGIPGEVSLIRQIKRMPC